ncbi:hypothetical protein D9M68_963910 [compost metagenome]
MGLGHLRQQIVGHYIAGILFQYFARRCLGLLQLAGGMMAARDTQLRPYQIVAQCQGIRIGSACVFRLAEFEQ